MCEPGVHCSTDKRSPGLCSDFTSWTVPVHEGAAVPAHVYGSGRKSCWGHHLQQGDHRYVRHLLPASFLPVWVENMVRSFFRSTLQEPRTTCVKWPAWRTPWWSSTACATASDRSRSRRRRNKGPSDAVPSARVCSSRWTTWVLGSELLCVNVSGFVLSSDSTSLIFQEAKMLIARAYRQTEKLLLDNRDKLTLVS